MPNAGQTIAFERADCSECPIRHNAVCALCEAEELARLNALKSYVSFDAGQRIAWMGEPLNFVGSIVSGAATLSQTMEDGRRQTVGLLLPSDFVGRPGRATASYDVEAVEPTVMCRFERPGFERLILESDAIKRRLIEMTMDELDAARDWMLVLGRKSAREKVASFLYVLARRKQRLRPGPDADLQLDLPMTREQIADYLGLTIETVSRQFGALNKAGVIRMDGLRRIGVGDLGRLMSEAGEDDGGPT